MPNYLAIFGDAGYIAPRHLKAIHNTGNHIVVSVGINDRVGLLNQFSFDIQFFTEIEHFNRHLEELRRSSEAEVVNFASIC